MEPARVCILDYGSGNVRSVYNLLLSMRTACVISNDEKDIDNSTHLILPGVGAFGAAMEKIKNRIPLDILKQNVFEHKKPFLGICVGMQVLADKGSEFGMHKGLGWIPGEVNKLDSGDLPLPHIGWNDIAIVNSCPLLNGLDLLKDFYFVHSYILDPADHSGTMAETVYGKAFASVVQKENIYGVQFHPEKSQEAGKMIMKNFLMIQ